MRHVKVSSKVDSMGNGNFEDQKKKMVINVWE
jgi:hypothetical protein